MQAGCFKKCIHISHEVCTGKDMLDFDTWCWFALLKLLAQHLDSFCVISAFTLKVIHFNFSSWCFPLNPSHLFSFSIPSFCVVCCQKTHHASHLKERRQERRHVVSRTEGEETKHILHFTVWTGGSKRTFLRLKSPNTSKHAVKSSQWTVWRRKTLMSDSNVKPTVKSELKKQKDKNDTRVNEMKMTYGCHEIRFVCFLPSLLLESRVELEAAWDERNIDSFGLLQKGQWVSEEEKKTTSSSSSLTPAAIFGMFFKSLSRPSLFSVNSTFLTLVKNKMKKKKRETGLWRVNNWKPEQTQSLWTLIVNRTKTRGKNLLPSKTHTHLTHISREKRQNVTQTQSSKMLKKELREELKEEENEKRESSGGGIQE